VLNEFSTTIISILIYHGQCGLIPATITPLLHMKNPFASDSEAGKLARNHQKFGYPNGILINSLFKSTMGANAELAPYLAFKGVPEFNSYTDIIGKLIHLTVPF
jgi:hypothetical protein